MIICKTDEPTDEGIYELVFADSNGTIDTYLALRGNAVVYMLMVESMLLRGSIAGLLSNRVIIDAVGSSLFQMKEIRYGSDGTINGVICPLYFLVIIVFIIQKILYPTITYI